MSTFRPSGGSVKADGPNPAFRWHRSGDDYVAEWPGVLTVHASPSGDIRQLTAAPDAQLDAVDKIRRGAAGAFVRALAGKPSLHGSSVALRGNALVCIGPSGIGKSTVAERLCRYADVGLLADDVVALDSVDGYWQVLPSESRLWLIPAAQHGMMKEATPVRAASESAHLGCIVALRFDEALEGPQLRRLVGASGGAALLESSIRFEITPWQLRRELDWSEGLASQAGVYELARPHGTSAESVAGLLVELLRALRA